MVQINDPPGATPTPPTGVPLAVSAARVPLAVRDFHPAIQAWFLRHFTEPTDAQVDGWPEIRARRDVLIAAPTGSGKTLAAFLAGIDALIRKAEAGLLDEQIEILYVSPLKALGSDIHRNLEAPLEEIHEIARELGYDLPQIRVAVRSGDTTPSQRQSITKHPPHILITTPESLYLMLTAAKARETLRHVRTLIVDEIHALVRDRRGSHMALSIARLDYIASERPARVGLSATQHPIDEIAAFLVGSDKVTTDGAPDCVIVDRGHQRDLELSIELPNAEMMAVASHEQWAEVYDRLTELIAGHRTTLIFVNTRRLAERVAHHLSERIGKEHVASHHGSLSKERRLQMEQRLKRGELRALVATASLELGIDVGSIDLVCQIASPRAISTFLQRVGRSGHALGLTPRGKLFPTTRDELVECAALVRAVRAGRLDRVHQPVAPLDVLAQQIVAETACQDWSADDLYALVRAATPYRDLTRQDFDDVVAMLRDGVGESGGRAHPLIHHDRINGVIRARRGARMKALTNGGTIPELGDFRVVIEPDGTFIGSVNEDWAIESMAGDIFLLGTTSWRIKRIESGTVRVENAHGAPPTIPFWLGESPGRTLELSAEVGALRRDVAAGVGDVEATFEMLREECGLDELGASQLFDYVRATALSLGVIPSDTDVVFERFFDEAGDQHLVVHAPFGARINRAWGLALRKRFCVRFDFELQAAANDDAIVLSIGPAQSFPLAEAFHYLKADNAEAALEQAILYVPQWGTRWRWNATRALAVERQRAGKKVPAQLQRMRADDLLAAVFPAQVGCQENISGPIDYPDHPLVRQSRQDCLREWMDTDGLIETLARVEAGEITFHARDTTEPSPMAHEIINGKPYTFLDDAPLEERRTRAVMLRHAVPNDARDLSALDPDAIARVREEAWPVPRDTEEVHDVLLSLVALSEKRTAGWEPWLDDLVAQGRAAVVEAAESLPGVAARHWFAAENLPLIELLFPGARIMPPVTLPFGAVAEVADREEARAKLLRGHCEVVGPVTATELAARSGLGAEDVERGLVQVEAYGHILRGRFSPAPIRTPLPPPTVEGEPPEAPDEFCDRRLLARIHRYTLDVLRKQIEPVGARDFMRFLLRWQHCTPDTRLHGKQGVRAAVERLQGFEAPAVSWERDLLPARVADYDPAWLDELCLDGTLTWGRLSPRKLGSKSSRDAAAPATPSRVMPVSLASRSAFPALRAATAAMTTGAPTTVAPTRAGPTRAGSPASDTASDTVSDTAPDVEPVSGVSRAVLAVLRERGALFFDEIVNGSHHLATEVEDALRDLVARGLVHADGFEGLRNLAGGHRAGRRRSAGVAGRRRSQSRYPDGRYAGGRHAGGRHAGGHYAGGGFRGAGPAGRWALVDATAAELDPEDLAERTADVLLARYGVIFRDLLTRESITVPWRHLLKALRRMEARGQVRGGRFVDGFLGEQYALAEAVDALRAVRKREHSGERVYLSAVDPCNLAGIILPGEKIAARPGDALTLIDGALPDDEESVGRIAWPRGPEQVVATPRADLASAGFADSDGMTDAAARRAVDRVTGLS